MSLSTVTVSETWEDGAEGSVTGTVTFTPSATCYDSGLPVVMTETPVACEIVGGQLQASGGAPVELIATDNEGLDVAGRSGFWFWRVRIEIQSGGATAEDGWDFFLPSSPDTVDLYALANTPASGGGSGTVTSVSVESANGFAGTVADDTTTPQVTLSTTVTGLLKGNGTAIAAATAGTDYLAPGGSGADLTGITAAQVGADAAGSAATAQSNAETYASGAASTAQSNAETYAAAQASAAQSAAEAASVAIGGDAMNGPLSPKVVTLTDEATVAVSAGAANDFRLTFTTAVGGTREIGTPSDPADGQSITFELIQPSSGGPCEVTWAAGEGGYSFGSGSAPTLSATASDGDLVAFRYSAVLECWCALGSATGF